MLRSCFLLTILIVFSGCQQQATVSQPADSSSTAVATKQNKKAPKQSTVQALVSTKPQTDWKLVWEDEFNGESLDLTKWKYETGASGWGNNELQNYTSGDNVEVSDGTLKITAKHSGEGLGTGAFTSARLNSIQTFQYGRMEIKAKLPESTGNGAWPAIWMLGENIQTASWPRCGELDIMEYVSYDPHNVHFTIHTVANNHGRGNHINSGPVSVPTCDSEFHVYGVTWTKDQLDFYLDDPSNIKLSVKKKPDWDTVDEWPFDQPFYFLLNIAVGGSWGGVKGVEAKAFPSTMEIDFVKVYQ